MKTYVVHFTDGSIEEIVAFDSRDLQEMLNDGSKEVDYYEDAE